MQNEESIIEDKYYQSITELPLHKYVDCLVDNNLSGLVIVGNPSPDLLALAWATIQQEYADAMNNEDYRLYMILVKEVASLEWDISIAESCVRVLSCVYEKTFADQLNETLRTSYKLDWTDQDAYHKELQRATNKAKALRNINLALKLSEVDVMAERFSSGDLKKPTREYFQSCLITLSDHAKYSIQDTITVYQFCDRIRRLNVYIEQVKQK